MNVRPAHRFAPVARTAVTVAAGYAAIAGLMLLLSWVARSLGYPEVGSRLPWYLSRASGITAYLLLSATTILGLAVSTRISGRWFTRPSIFGLHEHLAWLGLAVTGLHLGALLGDSYVTFVVPDLLLPFAASYRPTAVAFGVVTLYLSVILTGSFYVRRWIGQRTWRAIHSAGFVAYALATIHGILAGSSTGEPWMQWLYLTSAGAVLLLTNYRLLLARRSPSRQIAGHVTATDQRS